MTGQQKCDPQRPSGLPQYYSRLRAEMLPFVPLNAQNILDIGCAAGSFGIALQARGANVTGIEPNSEAAEIAARHLRRVYVAAVEEVLPNLPQGQFDCVVMNDVLEHLVDPWLVVDRIFTMLPRGGCLVASIPNLRHQSVLHQLLRNGDFKYVPEGILDRTHLRFFTRKSIRLLLEQAGFRIDEISGINPTVVPWKLRMLSRLLFDAAGDLRFQQFAVRAVK